MPRKIVGDNSYGFRAMICQKGLNLSLVNHNRAFCDEVLNVDTLRLNVFTLLNWLDDVRHHPSLVFHHALTLNNCF